MLVQFAGACAILLTTLPTIPQVKKEIRDPAEYNAYVGAIQQRDPQAKINDLLHFVRTYPNSAFKEDALEHIMALYQAQNDVARTMQTAEQLRQEFPNNLRALALLVYSKRVAAQSGQNPQQNQQDLADARQLAERGLEALRTAIKPEGMSGADFEKFKSQVAVVFNGATGLWSLQNKDYPNAQEHLRAAVNSNPNDFKDVYPLALAYLSPKPSDDVNGLWFAARSVHLARAAGFPEQSVNAIAQFGRQRFIKYYGSEDGWNQLLAQTKTTALPPGFASGERQGAQVPFSVVSIVSQPGGVQVYVDQTFKGITSEGEGELRVEGLQPAIHRLRLSLPGYKEWRQTFTLSAGQTLPVEAKMEPAGPKPLAIEEVEEALKNGISGKRVGELVKQFGVDFSITPEQETRLRAAGADGELLFLISKSKK